MVAARFPLSTIVLGLPSLLFLVLALSITILPVADAFYIPQEFNIDAARNETDRQVVPHAASCRRPRLFPVDDAGTVDVSAARSAALARRDVWSPGILSPNASDVWRAGSLVQVRWCVRFVVDENFEDLEADIDFDVAPRQLEQGYRQPARASHKLRGENTPGARAGRGRQ